MLGHVQAGRHVESAAGRSGRRPPCLIQGMAQQKPSGGVRDDGSAECGAGRELRPARERQHGDAEPARLLSGYQRYTWGVAFFDQQVDRSIAAGEEV